jgi:hypothetical protein
MVINHPQIMSWNAGIIKKRLNPDSTILLQDQLFRLKAKERQKAEGKGRKNEHPTSNVEWEYGSVVINREP